MTRQLPLDVDTFAILPRQMLHDRDGAVVDESFLVVWAEDSNAVEGVCRTREDAEAFAERLRVWRQSKPRPNEPSIRFVYAAADPPLEFERIEPNDWRLREFERERLVAAQAILALREADGA